MILEKGSLQMKTIEEKQSGLVSFMQAYLLSLGGLNQIMGIVLDRKDGIMIMNLIPLSGLLFLHFFISDKRRDLNLNKKALLLVYYVLGIILVYKYAFRHSSFTYSYALVYCFFPIYLSFYKVNVEKILKWMMFFSVLLIPVSGSFFSKGGYYYETIGMSTTYNVLPFVVAALLHFWYYRKNAGFFVRIGYMINVYYLFMVLVYGNRGPLISLIVLGILIILHKFKDDDTLNKHTTRTIAVTVLVGAGVLYAVDNFEIILTAVDKFLKSMGITISAIAKTIHKLEEGNLSNGRDVIFDFTREGIKSHFWVGNGISTMFYNSGYRYAYPHNLFLQLWYDLGIFVPIPMLWIIWKATKTTFFKAPISKSYATIMILLFTLSIPRLCYSEEFWTNIPFWFLLMYTISPNIYEIKHLKENEFNPDEIIREREEDAE